MTDHMNTHDVENETHRASCAECQGLWAELEAIAAEAAKLPLLTPSRDLWSGIEARISAPKTLPFYRRQSFRLAIAASLLIAVTSTVTWQLASRGSTPAVTVATDYDMGAGELQFVTVSNSVSAIDREIEALTAILDERRDELDPQTVAILERNLAVIDTAIAQTRAALAADPASQFLAQRYTRAYTSKLTLLRGAAQLPAGT